ncbi:MAG: enoyl-CoA hydratase/isomerase family protein [Sandaracinaceae bacterium]|nr:enoyl-CoA hydratase/isomerase family protein [Sandaracinaceae bacterium]
MTEPAVLYSRDGHVGVLTLNRPDQRNAMTPELLGDFAVAVERAKADRGARAVVLVGTGSCFSAGADLHSSLKTGDPNGLPHERSFAMYAPFLELRNVGVPVIAALQGHAVGGGFGLSLMADIRIANERDKYGANFARLGLHSGMAISFMLPRLVGVSRASELLYTGRLVIGAEAERIGLVSEALPGEQVFPRAMELAGEIALSLPARRASDEADHEDAPGLGRGGRRAARGAAAERVAHHRGRRRGPGRHAREARPPVRGRLTRAPCPLGDRRAS